MAVFTCCQALKEKFVEPSQHHNSPPFAARSETIPFVWQMNFEPAGEVPMVTSIPASPL